MEETAKKEIVYTLSGETDETVVSIFLQISEEIILNALYPYETEDEKRVWLSKYDMKQCQIATYLLNKRGAEGEKSHSENGITRTYGSSDIPSSMLQDITPFGKVL